jgi:serine/threonine protein kinase
VSDSEGVQFGRYRLLERLGRGGMAEVYRAVVDGPKGFSRQLVIKRIFAECAKSERFVNILAAEARVSALLHHPAIVQVHELGQVEGEFYLAMELIEGCDLIELLDASVHANRILPPGLACHIIAELADGLAYAHALTDARGRRLDIVHRDVSPSNVMISSLGEVKLVDFGIAKAADHIGGDTTDVGVLKGKIGYLSPEQASGQPIDRRADIFALGVVFWECLTCERLFRSSSDLETLRRIRAAQVPPPSAKRPGLDPAVDRIVLGMLAQRQETRFQSCDEVVQALAPVKRRLGGSIAALRAFLEELGPIARRGDARRITPADGLEPRPTQSLVDLHPGPRDPSPHD